MAQTACPTVRKIAGTREGAPESWLFKRSIGKERENIETNRTLRVLSDVSTELMVLENALTDIAASSSMSERGMVSIENQLRALRVLANQLWATEVVKQEMQFEDLNVRPYIGADYIEIEAPYWLVTQSSLFRVFGKKLSASPSLVSTVQAWHFLIGQVVKQYGVMPFDTPLTRARVTVHVLMPDRQRRDPDHFWFRPILDAFVRNGVLQDDHTGNVHLDFVYAVDRDNPAVIIQVQSEGTARAREVRSASLRPVSRN